MANFATPRPGGFSPVYHEFGSRAVVIVADVTGYILGCKECRLIREINGRIKSCWFQPDLQVLFFRMEFVLSALTERERCGGIRGFRGTPSGTWIVRIYSFLARRTS